MQKSILTQKIDFSISMFFIGSAALLGIVLILEAADMHNPVAESMFVVAAENGL